MKQAPSAIAAKGNWNQRIQRARLEAFTFRQDLSPNMNNVAMGSRGPCAGGFWPRSSTQRSVALQLNNSPAAMLFRPAIMLGSFFFRCQEEKPTCPFPLAGRYPQRRASKVINEALCHIPSRLPSLSFLYPQPGSPNTHILPRRPAERSPQRYNLGRPQNGESCCEWPSCAPELGNNRGFQDGRCPRCCCCFPPGPASLSKGHKQGSC